MLEFLYNSTIIHYMLNYLYTSNYNEISKAITTQTNENNQSIDDRSEHVKISLCFKLR